MRTRNMVRTLVAVFLLACLNILSTRTFADDGWCTSKAVDVEYMRNDPVSGTSGWHVFFKDDTNLGNLASDGYYFYYRDEYAGYNVLWLEGYNADRDQWQAQLSGTWVAGMQNEYNIPNPFKAKWRFWKKNNWRVDYRC